MTRSRLLIVPTLALLMCVSTLSARGASEANVATIRQHSHDIVKRVWDFFEEIPYHEMTPRADLVTRGYCLANPGHEYLVYLESRGGVSVHVENGPYAARWINAQDTADQRSAGTTLDGEALRTPGDGDDWLLHLTRQPERESAGSVSSQNSSKASGLEVTQNCRSSLVWVLGRRAGALAV